MSTRPETRVCLVTTGHVSTTPRLIKEADSLVAAGYQVQVVSGRYHVQMDSLDPSPNGWECIRVDGRRGTGNLVRKILRQAARRWIARTGLAGVRTAARARHGETLRIAAVAARLPAAFYFGNGGSSLAAAALAAKARGVPFGFDLEDFHDAETEAGMSDRAVAVATEILQRRLLPKAAFLTAASPLIAEKYSEVYGVHPTVLLNVFPRQEAPKAPLDPGPISAERPARFYWFSLTIGPGRGLEAAVAVLGRLRTPAELHLRGVVSADYRQRLEQVAKSAGLARPLQFLPPAPPREMIQLSAPYHFGLSTEERQPLNRDICLSNKIFTYLAAGVPQLLSHTSAQARLAPELGEAALLVDLADPDSAATRLDQLLGNAPGLAAARAAAWRLGQERFCWDVEQEGFLAGVATALTPHRP